MKKNLNSIIFAADKDEGDNQMYYENRPIKSTLKSKRIKWVEPYGPISWCGVKQIREYNKTKKVYEINPYAEVYQFRDNLYCIYVENADGMQDMWMHLIVGPKAAMLIDTGYGIGDTKRLVDMLTDNKPLIVVNSHGHCDHAYGNCRFDRVYCHEFEVPALEKQDEHIWDYLFDEEGNCIWLEFDKADLPQFKPYEIIGVKDGHKFDLGDGYEIELIWLGGHSPGQAAYLDPQNRLLFPGDDVSSQRVAPGGFKAREGMQYGEYATIPVFRDQLKKLAKRIDEFDYIFPGHLMLELESHLILSMLETCNRIVADSHYYQYESARTSPSGQTMVTRNTFVEDVGTRIGFRK